MDDALHQLNLVRAAKPRASQAFSRFGDVSGVGITQLDGNYALKVNFSALTAPREALPIEWEGIRVLCEVTGVIAKRQPFAAVNDHR